ncbi:type II toxin-antitoxin system RelE/ParE family toxin (plasmid) [Roseomonas mucosa]|jgi:toxin ParE1/3/4|uniref:type II toxin-antitoxin system RelE/ParE family toxin n=1 Tax=Roseomonas mucosa TaxID=207340 RepID=UPI0028CEC392|nr:type II toxin-antitoxin system RelE/ParE family toxin [Roseomonas mucosa]MDT8278816.1 type II toxin-antitoxin system RelE/ParE family toxin [Roseomonas mucosa]
MQSYAITFADAAVADLQRIREHIGRDNPAAASRIAVQIVAACDRLEHLPQRGRPGPVPGTRELATPWPYVIVYRIGPEVVEILRVWHGAQER